MLVPKSVPNSGTLRIIPAHVSGPGRRDAFRPDPAGTRLTDPLLSPSSIPGLTCPGRSDRIGAGCYGSSARQREVRRVVQMISERDETP